MFPFSCGCAMMVDADCISDKPVKCPVCQSDKFGFSLTETYVHAVSKYRFKRVFVAETADTYLSH